MYEHYYLAYVIQLIATMIGATNIAVVDGLLLAFFIFSLGQLKTIQYKIMNLKNIAATEDNDQKMYDYVIEIVKEHNIIIK